MNDEQKTQKLIDNLFFLQKALHRSRKIEAELSASDITVPQRIVLGILIRTGSSLSLKELSQKIGLSHSTASGIVDRLERKGYVERLQDPQDRRFTKITLSANVKDFVQNRKQHLIFAVVVDAFKNATPEEQVKIIDGLTILRQLMDKEE